MPSADFSKARRAPARATDRAGVAVALGSNFNLNHSPDAQHADSDGAGLRADGDDLEESLTAATINSAIPGLWRLGRLAGARQSPPTC